MNSSDFLIKSKKKHVIENYQNSHPLKQNM